MLPQVLDEARPILYGMNFRFDNTATLLQFLIQVGDKVRKLLSFVEIGLYQPKNAMNALAMLGECRALQRVHIGQGVAINATPQKAAKAFFADAGRFLESQASYKGDKDSALQLLNFGKSVKCFSIKEGDGGVRAWSDEEKHEFVKLLAMKFK